MLAVIIPTRERPHVVGDLLGSFGETVAISTTRLILAIDQDDPTMEDYREAVADAGPWAESITRIEPVQGGTMVRALNECALRIVSSTMVEAVGFLGDDHRPRTHGWDAAYLTALRQMGAGIVYGDDLLQHAFVPTQCAMSASIIRRLGWMAHGDLRHMYVDTLWRDMAAPVGKLQYLPDVIVEHMHYWNNKAKMDAGYERVNAKEVYQADEEAFRRLHATGKVREASAIIATLANEAHAAASVTP